MENADLRGRIAAIKEGLWEERDDGTRRAVNTQGAVQATISILSLIYGAPSQPFTSFLSRIEKAQFQYDGRDHNYAARIAEDIAGVLDTALADLESGLTASVQLRAKGAVLGDFVALAREALADSVPRLQVLLLLQVH